MNALTLDCLGESPSSIELEYDAISIICGVHTLTATIILMCTPAVYASLLGVLFEEDFTVIPLWVNIANITQGDRVIYLKDLHSVSVDYPEEFYTPSEDTALELVFTR